MTPPLRESILHRVFDHLLKPELERIASQIGKPITVRLTYADHLDWGGVTISIGENGDEHPNAEGRVLLKPTFYPELFNLKGKVIFERSYSPNTGFSGLRVEGKVRLTGPDSVVVEGGGVTISYNDWKWGKLA
jgi:hypothetical protein